MYADKPGTYWYKPVWTRKKASSLGHIKDHLAQISALESRLGELAANGHEGNLESLKAKLDSLAELGQRLVGLELGGADKAVDMIKKMDTNLDSNLESRFRIQTEDLMHTILRVIPVRHHGEVFSDINGLYTVYRPWERHLRHTVPSGWYWPSGAGPTQHPAPAMTALVRTSSWISRKPILAAQHGAMWCLTAAQLRNRSVGLTSIPACLRQTSKP
jgi:hypothetical protein